MSQENSKTIIQSLSKLSIVKRAMAFLNLGEEGKIESFYNKVIRRLTTEVNVIKQNLVQLKFNHDVVISNLKEKLEDAETAFEHAKINVDITKINTHEEQSKYVETFLDGLDSKVISINQIKKEIEVVTETYEKDKKDYEDQLDSLNKRLDFISTEAE